MEDLVSVIMFSRNRGLFVEESVRSIMAQTYENWELLFVDDSSTDDTIRLLMELKEEDRKNRHPNNGFYTDDRIKISQSVVKKGSVATFNSALREAKGRWIAFLYASDVWMPNKLKHQIDYMREKGCAISYSKYNVIDIDSNSRGVEVYGPNMIDEAMMMKCYWPGMLTVMYDAEKLGKIAVPEFTGSNSYALALFLAQKGVYCFIDECLASNRTKKGLFNGTPFSKKLYWRFEAYRYVAKKGGTESVLRTFVNLWYTGVKRLKYVKKAN